MFCRDRINSGEVVSVLLSTFRIWNFWIHLDYIWRFRCSLKVGRIQLFFFFFLPSVTSSSYEAQIQLFVLKNITPYKSLYVTESGDIIKIYKFIWYIFMWWIFYQMQENIIYFQKLLREISSVNSLFNWASQ